MQAPRLPRTRFLAAGAAALRSRCRPAPASPRTARPLTRRLGPADGPVARPGRHLGPAADVDRAGHRLRRPRVRPHADRLSRRVPPAARQRPSRVTWPPPPARWTARSRRWSFTLREGVTWQDGSPVTCEDVRYGVSRSFARAVRHRGPELPAGLPRHPAQGRRVVHLRRPATPRTPRARRPSTRRCRATGRR